MNNKDRIRALLKSIETGDLAALEVVNSAKYIQHNPQTHEGSEGLAALFKRLAKTSPQVNVVRAFEDGDLVFAHTEYHFSSSRVGFEVFRFEKGQAVEHWDNIQPRKGPSPSGHTMVAGPTEATDLAQTESHRALVKSFVQEVLIDRQLNRLEDYIDGEQFIQHDPQIADGRTALREALESRSTVGLVWQYHRLHRVLAEGSFVLAACEGSLEGIHSAFYHLFRLARGKLVEHWNTIEAIAPHSEWKNDNGKF